MPKKLTADKIAQLEKNANMMLDNGYSNDDIQAMSNQFIQEFGVDDTPMPEKKNESANGISGVLPSPTKNQNQKSVSPLATSVNDQFNKIGYRKDAPAPVNVSQYPDQGDESDVDHVKKVARKLADNFVPSYARKFVESKIDKATPLAVEAVTDKFKADKDKNTYQDFKKRQAITSFNDRMVNGDLTENDFNVVSQFVPESAMPSLKQEWNNNMKQTKQVVDGYLQGNVEKLDALKTGMESQIQTLDNQIAEIDNKSGGSMMSSETNIQKSILQEQKSSLQGKLDIGERLIQQRAEEKLYAIGDGLVKEGALGIFTDPNGKPYDNYGLLSDEAKQVIQTNVENFISKADPQTKYLLQQHGGTDREKLNARVYQIARNKIEYEYPAKQKTLSDIATDLKTKPKPFQELANTILGYHDEENVKNTAEKFKMVGGANFMELGHRVALINNELNSFVKDIQSSPNGMLLLPNFQTQKYRLKY